MGRSRGDQRRERHRYHLTKAGARRPRELGLAGARLNGLPGIRRYAAPETSHSSSAALRAHAFLPRPGAGRGCRVERRPPRECPPGDSRLARVWRCVSDLPASRKPPMAPPPPQASGSPPDQRRGGLDLSRVGRDAEDACNGPIEVEFGIRFPKRHRAGPQRLDP